MRSSTGEEQVFLALEVGVDGAGRVAGLQRDLVDRGAAQAVTGEHALGGIQQLGAGDQAPLAAAGAAGDLTFSHAGSITTLLWITILFSVTVLSNAEEA